MNLNWLATLYCPSGGCIFIDRMEDARHYLRSKAIIDSTGIVLVNHLHLSADDLLSYMKAQNINKLFSVVIAVGDDVDGENLRLQHDVNAFVPMASAHQDLKSLFGSGYLF